MPCEMCGKDFELVDVIIEGSLLRVCRDCSKFGNVVEVRKPKPEKTEVKEKFIEVEEVEEVMIDDYGEIIREARGRKGLTQEELAKLLAEKESVIQGVEAGRFLPFKLARKFEQFFRIRLIVPVEKKIKKNFNLKSEDLTVGDLMRMKKED